MKSHLAMAIAAAMLLGAAAQAQPNGASPRDKACAPGADSHLKMPDTPTPQVPRTPNATTGSGADLSDKLAQSDGVRLIERRPMPPLGHFSLIRFGKH